MIKDYETISIAKYMLEYAQLLQVEAERLDHLGVVPEPNLFDKAQEVYFLAEQINRSYWYVHS